MITKILPSHPALAPFVKHYLVYEWHIAEAIDALVACKVLGAILFSFKSPSNTSFRYSGMDESNRVFLGEKPAMIGPTNTFGHAYFEGEINILIVALQPTATQYFLRDDAQLLTNEGLRVESVTNFFNEAQERLLDVKSSNEAIQILEPYLFKYFSDNQQSFRQKDISIIADYIDQRNGLINVEALAKEFNQSRRWMEKQFQVQIGMSPKAYARAVRFRDMLAHLYSLPNPSFLDAVAKFNYTDQSHLIKDFYLYTSLSPLAYFKDTPLFEQIVHQTF
jgi:AraC-like DNA-binding protein